MAFLRPPKMIASYPSLPQSLSSPREKKKEKKHKNNKMTGTCIYMKATRVVHALVVLEVVIVIKQSGKIATNTAKR
jgi:hypothetical protein